MPSKRILRLLYALTALLLFHVSATGVLRHADLLAWYTDPSLWTSGAAVFGAMTGGTAVLD